MTINKLTDELVEDSELQMLIDSHEKGTAMFMRVDSYYLMAKELQERRKADSAEPVSFDELNAAVAEVTGGNQHAWDANIYKGHQEVPFMNYNSLARIVDKYRVPQPAPVVPEEIDVNDPALDTHRKWMAEGWNRCRSAMLHAANSPVTRDGNGGTVGKTLTVTLPDTSSKAFWSGSVKNEVFYPETYKRWVKEAIERACVITGISVVVK